MFVSMLNGAIQDTDFEEEYDQIRNPNGGMGGWYGIFLLYKSRGLDVGANIALAFKYWSDYCSGPDADCQLPLPKGKGLYLPPKAEIHWNCFR
jgi:hypothetical protein